MSFAVRPCTPRDLKDIMRLIRVRGRGGALAAPQEGMQGGGGKGEEPRPKSKQATERQRGQADPQGPIHWESVLHWPH